MCKSQGSDLICFFSVGLLTKKHGQQKPVWYPSMFASKGVLIWSRKRNSFQPPKIQNERMWMALWIYEPTHPSPKKQKRMLWRAKMITLPTSFQKDRLIQDVDLSYQSLDHHLFGNKAPRKATWDDVLLLLLANLAKFEWQNFFHNTSVSQAHPNEYCKTMAKIQPEIPVLTDSCDVETESCASVVSLEDSMLGISAAPAMECCPSL